MTHVRILDCTLRDGGYAVDSQFGDSVIRKMIHGLIDARVDVVECGFLQDDPHVSGSTKFNHAAQLREYLPEARANTSLVLLADYSRYRIAQLEPYDGSSIHGVRACFFKHEFVEAREGVLAFCRQIMVKGYDLYVQPVDALSYNEAEWCDLIYQVNLLKPKAFSIVDTFGSMYSSDLERIFKLSHQILTPEIHIGFHSHNNLQLSFSLALELIRLSQLSEREIIIDATVFGMGRGAGNTNIELLMHYLNQHYGKDYDLDITCDLYDNYISPLRALHVWGYSMAHFLAGAYSAHTNNISHLLQKNNINSKTIHTVLSAISPDLRKRYDYEKLDQAYADYQCRISRE